MITITHIVSRVAAAVIAVGITAYALPGFAATLIG